VEIVADITARN